MKMQLKPIKPKTISDQVFDQLREIIARGSLKPGEQLMPERDLAKAFGVSRTTIRNAINRLMVMGIVENRQGKGTFVRLPDSRADNPLALAMEAGDADLEDLLEFRLGLECNSAFLAANRATRDDIRFLEKSIEDMEGEIAEGGHGTEPDASFHMAIAYASKNPVQIQIMREFYDFLFYGIRENLAHLYEDPERTRSIVAQHTDIMNAIKAHDPKLAFEKMRRHIEYVLEFFRNHRV
jgi:GntR family transcriptional repressor for pyruvate dehydrogenase complex